MKSLAFNSGGHVNHCFYWEQLSPINKNGGVRPGKESKLYQSIEKEFGGFDHFVKLFSEASVGV